MTEELQSASSPRSLGRAAGFVAVVLVVWLVLALRNPQLTYHFAPLIAAVVGPASLRSGGRVAPAEAVPVAVGTGVVVGLVSVALHLTGSLEGPTFWNDGPALTESILFAALGAVFGARIATRDRPGLLGSVFEA